MTTEQQLNKSKKRGILFIILIIIIIVVLILLNRCGCNKIQDKIITNQNVNAEITNEEETKPPADDEFPDLSGCIVEIITDYHSFTKVTNETEVGNVFKQFITWAKENHKEVFPGKGNNWQFAKAEPHGTYQGIKYWKVTGLWFSEQKQEWLPQTVLDVNQNGKVIRLLGCL